MEAAEIVVWAWDESWAVAAHRLRVVCTMSAQETAQRTFKE